MTRAEGHIRVSDPTFALWLRWRQPGGTVVPMTVIGDEAERRVAEVLVRLGFDLVYQSGASRGSFDLLATRGIAQVGIQVKRSKLPLRFDRESWDLLEGDVESFGWAWLVAAVGRDGKVTFVDPAQARKRKEVRIGESAAIDNVVRWLTVRG